MTIVFQYFDVEDALKFQVLNKHMYNVRTPSMCSRIVGRQIEPEVCIYDVYFNSKNKLSVVVGDVPEPGSSETVNDKIQSFLAEHPMFALKFEY